jgi:hypothetical protein
MVGNAFCAIPLNRHSTHGVFSLSVGFRVSLELFLAAFTAKIDIVTLVVSLGLGGIGRHGHAADWVTVKCGFICGTG